jgi:hypothetical protein
VASTRSLTYSQALALFREDGELAATLDAPVSAAEFDALVSDPANQTAVRAYLALCQQRLRQSSVAHRARSMICGNDPQRLPPTLGYLAGGTPPPLRDFEKAPYHKGDYLVYPYTYDNEVTLVRAQTVTGPIQPIPTCIVTRPGTGVFMEPALSEESPFVYVMSTELAACRLYAALSQRTTQPPAIVTVAGFPFPRKYTGLKQIFLVSTADAPYTLRTALHLFAAAQYVDGLTDPSIYMCTLPRSTSMLNKEYMDTRIHRPVRDGHYAFNLATWLVIQIDEAARTGNLDEVYRAFGAVHVPEPRKQELLQRAAQRKVSPDTMQLIENAGSYRQGEFVLHNGRVVQRTQDGFKGLKLDGTRMPLSNISFGIVQRIVTDERNTLYQCELQAPDAPLIHACLPESAFVTSKQLQRAISHAYSDAGHSPYVACYRVPGFEWADICAKLAEGCPTVKEVSQLGVDEQLNVHFANVMLNTTRQTVEEQQRVFSLEPQIRDTYRGITASEPLDAPAIYRQLFGNTDNMYVAAFTAAICHVVHQIRSALAARAQDRPFTASHLLFVESEQEIWTPVYTQLVRMFADTDIIPAMPAIRTREYLERCSVLGSLPLFTAITGIKGTRVQRAVLDSQVGLVGLVDSNVAMLVADSHRTSFVVPTAGKETGATELDPETLHRLQQAFAWFVLDIASRELVSRDYRGAKVPAQAAYEECCEHLGVTPNGLFAKLVRPYYVGLGYTGAKAFFHLLYRVLYSKEGAKMGIEVVNGRPCPADMEKAAPPLVFVLDDRVLVSRQLVDVANRISRMGIFKTDNLTLELEDSGFLADFPAGYEIDQQRFWCVDRETWNKYVMKQPLALDPVRAAEPIKLRLVS